MIAAFFLLLAAIFTATRLARRLSVFRHFGELGALSRRSVAILTRRCASDWAKERATRILAARMMLKSLTAGTVLATVAFPVVAAVLLGPLLHVPTTEALFDPGVRLTLLLTGACLVAYRILANSRSGIWQAR